MCSRRSFVVDIFFSYVFVYVTVGDFALMPHTHTYSTIQYPDHDFRSRYNTRFDFDPECGLYALSALFFFAFSCLVPIVFYCCLFLL